MKTSLCNPVRSERGSAVLVVLVLLACIALLLYENSQTLYLLEQEIRLLDAKQQIKYEPNAKGENKNAGKMRAPPQAAQLPAAGSK